MSSSFTYTSFPPVTEDSGSPPSCVQDRMTICQSPISVHEMNAAEISVADAETRVCSEKNLIRLDPASTELYILPPTTPVSQRSRRATMPERLTKPGPQELMGLYSPPQTPEARIEKSTVISPSRPQTPPPSTHHIQPPETPKTPTHHPLVPTEERSLFEDMAEMQPPPTPVLYNLIRNEGAQKFVAAAPPRNKDRIEGTGVSSAELTVVPEEDEEDTSLRGHPSACLFVASLNSTKSEDHLRKSVTDLFSQWGTLLNVKVLKDWANRPFSFVQYATAQEANFALSQCQKSILDGRMIRVERARVNRTLYISKEKGRIDEAAIKQLLEPFGQIEEIVIPGSWKRAAKDIRKGCFARFVFRDDAIDAYQSLRFSDTYSIEWAQNLDRTMSPPPAATMPKVPIDYTSIFIGQLDRTTNEKAVRDRFGRYGNIVNIQVLSKSLVPTRRPESTGGFAFVKFDGREAATKAVKAENGATLNGRTIRVQYRELHQKLVPNPALRLPPNQISSMPKLAPPPIPSRPQPLQPQGQRRKMPTTLGQLSGTGGISGDALNGFGGFDPVTGLANGYNNINPQFFAAYNAALAAANAPPSNLTANPKPADGAASQEQRLLNPLAPPFVVLHPLQLLQSSSAFPILNRQQSQDTPSQPIQMVQQWYPHPPAPSSTNEQHPFPTVPTPPHDFASPIPLGSMIAVQSLLGFSSTAGGEGPPRPGLCWDPVVGMYRSVAPGVGSTVAPAYEQQGAANAA